MTPELKNKLLTVLDYVLAAEQTHYEESDEPEDHIYVLALQAKADLTTEDEQ